MFISLGGEVNTYLTDVRNPSPQAKNICMQYHRFRRSKFHTTKKQEQKKLIAEYNKWQPITETRSFLIWKGKHFNSEPEQEIEKILISHNLKFYREVSFDMKTRFDFYIPLIDLVIEYDGYFHLDLKRMEKDREKEKLLIRLGIKLIRYNKNHDLKKQIKHDLIYHPVLRNK